MEKERKFSKTGIGKNKEEKLSPINENMKNKSAMWPMCDPSEFVENIINSSLYSIHRVIKNSTVK